MVSGSALVERTACPGCGGQTFDTLLDQRFSDPALVGFFDRHYEGRADIRPLAAEHFQIVRCRDCSLSFQKYVPGAALLEQIYDVWIPLSEKERLRQERTVKDYAYSAEQVQFLIQQLGLRPSQVKVLDFGMGWSEWLGMARAFGCEVAGAELSEQRIAHAKSLGIEVFDWDEIGRRQFNFINTEQVFEHLVEPLPVARHLAQALAPGGLLRISVPDSRRALARLGRGAQFQDLSTDVAVPVAPLEHVNCFDNRSLIALARHAGLRLVKPRLSLLYNSSSGWFELRNACRLALRPIYRHVFPGSTVLYFTRA